MIVDWAEIEIEADDIMFLLTHVKESVMDIEGDKA